MRNFLRILLGLVIGASIAVVLSDYAGLPFVLFSYSLDQSYSVQDKDTYRLLGGYCTITAVLLLALGWLTMLEFLKPKIRPWAKPVTTATLCLLVVLAVAHLIGVQFDLVSSQFDAIPRVVAALAINAWLVLLAVASFVLLRTVARRPQPSTPEH